MKKNLLSVLMLLVAAVSTQAKSWKIGPASVNGMDFASINAAMNSSQVVAGDTLYLDQYYNENQIQTITKKVVIIGTGYDTSLTDEQVVATLTNNLEFKANYSEIKSVSLRNVYFFSEGCTLDRCYCTYIGTSSVTTGMNYIHSCYIEGRIVGYSSSPYTTRFDIQNCIVYNNGSSNLHTICNLNSSVIKNNVLWSQRGGNSGYCTLGELTNTQIIDNIIYGWNTNWNNNADISDNVKASGSGNSIEHNITTGAAMTYFPTNKTGYKTLWSTLFTCSGNYSDYFKLAEESGDNPAIGYATDGGDCGCHGGMFGNPAGGRPQYIPYFSKVVVGSRAENGKLPVSVTVKIQDE